MMQGVLSMPTMTEADLRRINLEEIMKGCKKIIVQHGRRPYFLTITRRGNLILTAADNAASIETVEKNNDSSNRSTS